MASLQDFIPNAASYLGLPIEERAQVMLRFIAAYLKVNRSIARTNVTMEDSLWDVSRGVDLRELQLSITEAWVWLERELLILPAPDSHQPGWFIIAHRGQEFLAHASPIEWVSAEKMEQLGPALDPELSADVGTWFRRANFTRAAGTAFLTVELRIRSLSGVGEEQINPEPLMGKVFGDGGALRIPSQSEAQAKAVRMLFQGAMGRFRNPHLHGSSVVKTAQEAVRLIQFADLLLSIAAEHAAAVKCDGS